LISQLQRTITDLEAKLASKDSLIERTITNLEAKLASKDTLIEGLVGRMSKLEAFNAVPQV
jgi:uncharacterized coiled-coil protein SlyX